MSARAGGRISLYVSLGVESDLAVLQERYPSATTHDLMRLALSWLADDAMSELAERDAARIQEDAYGRWN